MSRSRRPSVSIHDYPEDLNPFNDGTPPSTQNSFNTVELRQNNKEPKNKFWTFGRSKKKRSNSFSVKSAWNGLFGKRKEPEAERRTTITTVSTSYQNFQNGQYGRPVPPPRSSKDQQEFEQAFGTFTRRKKYTMDSSSTYGSNLTVNGDPARLYNGSPQDTTASILGELTPKPPARRFGQVSPRPKDEIPPLEFEVKQENCITPNNAEDRIQGEVPVPTRRLGRRSQQVPQVNVLDVSEEEERVVIPSDVTLRDRDENENLPDDSFIFRRCSQDAVRRSNLSINSCVSTASCYSTLGRKKRRAPQPPQRRDSPENKEEKSSVPASSSSPIELQITESIDIAKVTEDIQQMTKESENIDSTINNSRTLQQNHEEANADTKLSESEKISDIQDEKVKEDDNEIQKLEVESKADKISLSNKVREEKEDNGRSEKSNENSNKEIIEIENIEINRIVEDTIEIIKEVNDNKKSDDDDDDEDGDIEIRKKKSGAISRSDSFSVKEQIEQIERQIKELESKNSNNSNNNNINNSNNNINNNNSSNVEEIKYYEPSETRLSIQANRRSFFKNMVGNNNSNGVKIEIKELPREQKDIQVVKLTDSPVPIEAPKEPVKVVALHISEPIKQVPEIVDDFNVNPLPKPRRHSSTPAQSTLNNGNYDSKVSNDHLLHKNRNTRGDSL